MIERLSRSERWIIAERQRWLSYILVATGLVLLLMVILSLIVLSVDKSVRNIDILQVAMAFPVVLPFLYLPLIYCFIGISVRYHVSAKLTWWLVVFIVLIPVLQLFAGVVLCFILLRDWRQQDLDVRWYGPTTAALRAMEIRNLCHQCEYDLTGNESGVCPECGSRVKERSQ